MAAASNGTSFLNPNVDIIITSKINRQIRNIIVIVSVS
jgi:hypothetical protein